MKKDQLIHVWVDKPMKEELKDLAWGHRMTLSAVVREAIKEKLEKEENDELRT